MSLTVSPRTVIQQLRDTNGQNSEACAKVARSLETAILTGFTSIGAFISEFLQNASDQAEQGTVAISYLLQGRRLIIFHNGKLFDEKDVRGVCDYANAEENQKGNDVAKTGYKDIGFKAIFMIASRVDVVSGQWRFHFDENNARWKRAAGERPYPWQISPLWTEEALPADVEAIASQPNRTTFVCHLRDELPLTNGSIERELKQWAQLPEDVLFLSKISQVFFSINGEIYTLLNKEGTIYVNDKPVSRWKSATHTPQIPVDVKQYLASLKPAECPKRLQTDTNVKLLFYYKQDQNGFIANQGSKLFCTLPTGVRTGFPFLVTGPFLLNPARETLLDNPWNAFLVSQVAKANFLYFRNALLEARRTALRVLAPPSMAGVSERLSRAFGDQMAHLFADRAIFPAQRGPQLLKLPECINDTTRFYSLINEMGLPFHEDEKMVHPDLSSSEFLQRFPEVTTTSLETIITHLPAFMKAHPDAKIGARLLLFFSTIFKRGHEYNSKHLKLLMEQRFVLTARNSLAALDRVMLPLESRTALQLPASLPLDLIHPELLSVEIVAWLKEIGLKPLTAEKIRDAYAAKLDDPSLKDKANNLQIIRFFFALYQHHLLTDLKLLRGILLVTQNGSFRPSDQSYLPRALNPKLPLEDVLAGQPQLLVSSEYFFNGESATTWKKFLGALGVYDKCEFSFERKIEVGSLRRIPDAHMVGYLDEIFKTNNPKRPRATKNLSYHDDDTVAPFVSFPFIDWVQRSEGFRNYFWRLFVACQDKIVSECSTTTYHASHKASTEQEAYLQYLFRTQPLVPDTRGGPFKTAKALYAPSLAPLIGNRFSTALLPVNLSLAMEQFLGFKRHLDSRDCAQLLASLQADGYRHDAYKLAMQHLLLNVRQEGQRAAILKEKWQFQAVNNSWQPSSKLKLWAFPNSLPPQESSDWIKPIFGTEKELEEFCKLFGISIVNEYRDRTLFGHARQCDDLKLFLLEKIPEIAYHWARHRGFERTPTDYVRDLLARLDSLQFFLIPDEISDDETSVSEAQTSILDNCLYYLPDWQDNKDRLGWILGEFFGFDGSEISTLKSALKCTKPYRGDAAEKMKTFRKTYAELCAAPPALLQAGIPPLAPPAAAAAGTPDVVPPLAPLAGMRTATAAAGAPVAPLAATTAAPVLDIAPTTTATAATEAPLAATTTDAVPGIIPPTEATAAAGAPVAPLTATTAAPVLDIAPTTTATAATEAPLAATTTDAVPGIIPPTEAAGAPETSPLATAPATPKMKTGRQPWSPQTPADQAIDSPMRNEPAQKLGWKPKAPPRHAQKKAGKQPKQGLEETEETHGLSDLDKKRIGLWAEEHLLWKRVRHYTKKYNAFDPQVTELPDGIKRITCQKKKISIDLKWHNDPNLRPDGQKEDELWDSGQHYDIQVVKNVEGTEKEKQVEVKGTTGNQVHFFLQALEWRTQLEDPSKYRIFTVTKVGTDDAQVTPIRDLMKAITERRLIPLSPVEFRG